MIHLDIKQLLGRLNSYLMLSVETAAILGLGKTLRGHNGKWRNVDFKNTVIILTTSLALRPDHRHSACRCRNGRRLPARLLLRPGIAANSSIGGVRRSWTHALCWIRSQR